MTRFRLEAPLLLLAACGGGATVIEPPPPPADEFTLTLRADPEDASSAQALGWTAGIPETDVTLTPKAPATGAPQTHRTSAAGKIVIAKLPAADYLVEARRFFTETERGRLAAGDDAVGFVVKTTVRAAAGGGSEVVSALASRRRSLVLSEFFNNYTYPAGVGVPYFEGAFVELYNNADTTIYLDGMILGRALAHSIDSPNFPCSLYYPYSRDQAGVWLRWLARVPGNGRDHPIAPGSAVVIATDAIDHSSIVPGAPDLRAAQFEMIGFADVDNPSVPNMIDLTIDGVAAEHGNNWPIQSFVTVLAGPSDLSALPHSTVQDEGRVHVRIPREKILDVLSSHSTYVGAFPHCPAMVDLSFDRGMGYLFLGDEFALSAQRLQATMLPNGRKILQHTRNSSLDFSRGSRSAGIVP